MSDIKFIAAAIDVVHRNHKMHRNLPPYVCFDENWVDIGRCHNFFGADCELIFEESFEATYTQAARPKQVYVELKGAVVLDPVLDTHPDPLYILVPSRKGMESKCRQPIWCNGISAHTRVEITGSYTGRYQSENSSPLWIECDEMVGQYK